MVRALDVRPPCTKPPTYLDIHMREYEVTQFVAFYRQRFKIDEGFKTKEHFLSDKIGC